ncbi:MAG: DUF3108 domain-containing protein [Candidatus Omnitrophica bacterium]|nr:DUF3108 domain-containing protein [Candidatus Omnitrophota bacterium]
MKFLYFLLYLVLLIFFIFSYNLFGFSKYLLVKETKFTQTQPTKSSLEVYQPTPTSFKLEVGERLEYIFNYFFLATIKLSFEVKEIMKIDNIDCFHIVATAQTQNFLKLLKNIKYKVHTYIDTKNCRPIKFLKYKIVGRKITEELIDFDYSNGIAIWKYTGQPTKKIPIQKDTQDLLSLFYYFRFIAEQEKKYTFSMVYNGRVWPVTIEVNKPIILKYKGKKIKVFKIQPQTQLLSYIIKGKTLTTYFTIDSKRIPLMFELSSAKRLTRGILKDFLPK